jgi:LL-diaminopimelate aminotransferase
MIEVANRLKHVEEYYFSKKLREVALLKAQGKAYYKFRDLEALI